MIFALSVSGPTASGKTAVSIELAKHFGGEVIGCDSMQIYREMSIGTAKPTVSEMSGVPHHLIDFLSPEESFSVERYRSMAMCAANDITKRGRLPIIVGGTGLYLDSLLRDPACSPESNPEYRDRLLGEIKSAEDTYALWERLNAVDPESAAKINKNNVKRVIRALEIYETTGRKKSELDKETRKSSSDILVGMITVDFHDRENLYRRADERVDIMLREGLLEETESLYKRGFLNGNTTASAAIGYKELLTYIRGEKTLCEATEDLKTATRRYAKRQLTWFRRYPDALRLYPDGEDGVMKDYDTIIREAQALAERLIENNKALIAER